MDAIIYDLDMTLIGYSNETKSLHLDIHIGAQNERKLIKQAALKMGIPKYWIQNTTRVSHTLNRIRGWCVKNNLEKHDTDLIMNAVRQPFYDHSKIEQGFSVLFPGAIEVLGMMEDLGYRQSLVTTAPRQNYEALISEENYARMHDYFEVVVCHEDTMFIKPLPHPIQVALDKMGSSDFVMVGNSTHDAVAARAAGGYFILHNTDKHEEITLKIIRPDAIINSLYELPKAVQKIN